jgi:hypothetical protein
MFTKNMLIVLFFLITIGNLNSSSCEMIKPNEYFCGIEIERWNSKIPIKVDGASSLQKNYEIISAFESILVYQFLYVSQEELISKLLKNSIEDQLLSNDDILSLHGWAPEAVENAPVVLVYKNFKDLEKILFVISQKKPLLTVVKIDDILYNYILMGMYFEVSFDRYGKRNGLKPKDVIVQDLSKINSVEEGIKTMRWIDFRNVIQEGYFISTKGL